MVLVSAKVTTDEQLDEVISELLNSWRLIQINFLFLVEGIRIGR